MNRLLKVENMTVKVTEQVLVSGVNLELKAGDRFLIIGPNGAGKSTLLKGIAQGISYEGRVYAGENFMGRLKGKERARYIGMLSQNHHVNYSFTVEEIVAMGRYAYAPNMFSKNLEDQRMIKEALEMTGLWGRRKQSILTLSGGEVQRTFLAQIFAQDPHILLLDEPANHLDIQFQKQIFSLIDQWIRRKNKAVIAVVHDLSLAALFGNQFLLLNEGKVVAQGSKSQVLVPEVLNGIYQMDVKEWMRDLYESWV